jgi:hypothetical protein
MVVRPVVQLERTGCGIASVAALVGVTYAQAKRAANRMGIFAEDRRLWSETRYVRRLLKHYHLHASRCESRFITWSALPDRALLAIKWHREKGLACWHWVVFVRKADCAYVLDSKKSLRRHARSDFGRIRPKWFITVI